MDKKEIKRLILEEGLTITYVIDCVIDINGIIGVGLISLGDGLKDYVYNKSNTSKITESGVMQNGLSKI